MGMSGVVRLVFGGREHERLVILVRGYSYPGATDRDDGNWLNAKVSVDAGAFTGAFECSLRTEDLVSLESGLARLVEDLLGATEFQTMEEQLSFTVRGDGIGHFEVSGTAVDQSGIGNRLSFSLEVDLSQLSGLLDDVRAATKFYPVRGV